MSEALAVQCGGLLISEAGTVRTSVVGIEKWGGRPDLPIQHRRFGAATAADLSVSTVT